MVSEKVTTASMELASTGKMVSTAPAPTRPANPSGIRGPITVATPNAKSARTATRITRTWMRRACCLSQRSIVVNIWRGLRSATRDVGFGLVGCAGFARRCTGKGNGGGT